MNNRIILQGRLTSDRAAALRETLLAAPKNIPLDGTEVQAVGALCAQELQRARETRSGPPDSWHLTASREMRADLELLGLSAILEELGDKE